MTQDEDLTRSAAELSLVVDRNCGSSDNHGHCGASLKTQTAFHSASREGCRVILQILIHYVTRPIIVIAD